jgi:hypothetical protein
MRQKCALGCSSTAAWRQPYAAYADTTYYASERFSAFSLLSKTLEYFGDSNYVGQTTLILTINTWPIVVGIIRH